MARRSGERAYRTRAALGIAIYLALAFAPLSLMLLSPLGPARAPLQEFAVALGFVALGILGTQFAVAARIGRLKAPYGVDAVYYFHRRMAVVALGLAVAHPALLIAEAPGRIGLLNVVTAPWPARYAVATVAVLAGIIATSLWRRKIRLGYETWHAGHGLAALVILVLAALHATGTGIYTDDWKTSALLFYLAIWVATLGYIRIGKPLAQLRRPYRVTRVERESPDTWTLTFSPEGHDGLRFRPGQHAWITLGRSPFSFEAHPFSFSSSPNREGGGFDMTIKELGDFTSTIGTYGPGTIAYVDGPFGAFTTDRHPATRYAFIAGGVGITPLMSMVRDAADRGDETPISLVYGAATREDLVFSAQLDELSSRIDLATTYVLEDPPQDWEGETGIITGEVLERSLGSVDAYEYFICGPPAMIDGVARSLEDLGVDKRRLHYERFEIA